MENKNPQSGSILIYTAVIIFIFSMVMIGLLGYAASELRVTRSTVYKEQAFQVAEAGVNYYQWHLANFPSDYYDGNASTTPGPYVHNYVDEATGQTVGTYSLRITVPPVGSTIVTIASTGFSAGNPQVKRTVTVRYGIPSLAQYAFLTNTDAWIGGTESVSGPFFSNGGIRFDGTGNAAIGSARSTYTCQWYHGCGAANGPGLSKPGIWGTAPFSTQVFWQFPLPNVSFSAITANLANMKTSAQSGGLYLPPSSALGYSLLFKVNGTIDVYKVTSLQATGGSGQDVNGVTHVNSLDYNNRTFQFNQAIPANGIIYIEDYTWVEGIVNGRAMVAAAKLPYTSSTTAPSIIIPNSICYTVCGAGRDNTSTLGLLAQQEILIPRGSPNNLEIDAAMIAQNGSAQRYFWSGNTKNSITIFGTVASYGVWTWSWNSPVNSGYINTTTIYDGNLLYSPPPSFPLTSNGYQQLSWNSN